MLDEEGDLARSRRLDGVEELHRLNDANRIPHLHGSTVGRHLGLAGSIAPVERAVERREDWCPGHGLRLGLVLRRRTFSFQLFTFNFSCRPADLLKPGLVKAAEELPPNTIKAEEDILSYALFPEVALGYFKWRKEGGPIPADSEATAGSASGSQTSAPSANSNNQTIKQSNTVSGTPVLAPLNGTFYRSDAPGKPEMAADGAAVKQGEAVCVVEAMKLFNPIKAPAAGKITFLVEHGKPVTKGQPVASIV